MQNKEKIKKTKDLQLSFLVQIIIIFLVTASFSLAVAHKIAIERTISFSYPHSTCASPFLLAISPCQSFEINVAQFLASFFLITALLLISLKAFKSNLVFDFLFAGAIIYGAQAPLGIFLSKIGAFLVAILIVALRFFYQRIWTQNMAIIFGAAGIAVIFGANFKPIEAFLIIIMLSFYDIIAVYKTRHMIKLFRGMAEKGAIFALMIPKSFSLWLNKPEEIKLKSGTSFVFLGTGDLILPSFLAVSSLTKGIEFSLAILGGTIIGLAINHFIFINQKEKKPIPALPSIAFFSAMGYVIISVL